MKTKQTFVFCAPYDLKSLTIGNDGATFQVDEILPKGMFLVLTIDTKGNESDQKRIDYMAKAKYKNWLREKLQSTF